MYEQLEPFDGQRTEVYLAQIAMILANAHRGKNTPAIAFKDCLVKFGEHAGADTRAKKDKFFKALSVLGGGSGGKDSNRKPSSPPRSND